jgi:P-type E1-E2 ATPase
MLEAGLAPLAKLDNAAVHDLESAGKTAVLVGGEHQQIIGCIAMEDAIKPDTLAALGALRVRGIKMAMLTGDNKTVAGSIARRLGIDTVHAEVLPSHKARGTVAHLRWQIVGVGVGVGVVRLGAGACV